MAKILVVDDEKDMRELLADTFPQHEVIEAVDGQDAKEKIEGDSSIQLVVTDNNMRRMEGTALLIWARQARPNLPVIIMSAKRIDGLPEDATFVAKGSGFWRNMFLAVEAQLRKSA